MSMFAIVDAATGALEQVVISIEGCDVAGRDIVAVDHLPDMAREYWDTTARAFVVDLVKLRARRWAEARDYRDARINGGCATALGFVDTNSESRLKISGAVQMALISAAAGSPFVIDWTMQDNSVTAHDGPATIAMGVAVGQFVNQCHSAATDVRAALDGATSIEAIAAVDVEAGYPA